ncbi:MAG: AraC family transcriptional regulator [Methylobacteriaceae bacterium]|nr:AraC family transcriptional regulator [Methylobacteriaceae bacterium]
MTDPDHLAALFAHATPTARTFFTGTLCRTAEFPEGGHLHLLKAGALTFARDGGPDLVLAEPTLLFLPRTCPHRFLVDPERGADLACAVVDLGGEAGSPIAQGLPATVTLPLARHPALAAACELLLGEAFTPGDGRQAALDRLFDYLLILVVRHVIASGLVEGGVLAGLADPRLARALTALHESPRRAWSLDDLATAAGMSRTRFAAEFAAVVGRTPIDYLTHWRMTIARQLLRKGKPVKSVAAQVGYDSPAAFSRTFARVTGQAPRSMGARAAADEAAGEP